MRACVCVCQTATSILPACLPSQKSAVIFLCERASTTDDPSSAHSNTSLLKFLFSEYDTLFDDRIVLDKFSFVWVIFRVSFLHIEESRTST